ncbi:MAG: hypothetical protein K2Y37_20930 [Pirellulales bacterium]|nr:hypothetical protein [Pirellulales bacterium]
MKKVSFGAKKPSGGASSQIDAWVESREVIPETLTPTEKMKRLTIDVPIPLHKRIKSQCALNNLVMADVIRELLEQRFPQPSDLAIELKPEQVS